MFTKIKGYYLCILVASLLLLILVGLSLADINGRSDSKEPKELTGYTEPNIKPILSRDGINTDSNPQKSKSTIAFKIHYEKCGHTVIEELDQNKRANALGALQYELDQKDWVLDELSPGRLVFKKTIDSYCPKHYIVKDKDGYLAIYKANSASGKLYPLEETNIRADSLDGQVKDKLKDGIVIDNLEGVELFIEDISS